MIEQFSFFIILQRSVPRAGRGGSGIAAHWAAALKHLIGAGITARWAANGGKEAAALRAGSNISVNFGAAIITKKTRFLFHYADLLSDLAFPEKEPSHPVGVPHPAGAAHPAPVFFSDEPV